MALIGIVAVMLFGSRLPEVAGQLGKSYQQFRKGLDEIKSNIKTDIDLDVSSSSVNHLPDYSQQPEDDYDAPSSPVFDAPEEEEE